MFNMPGMNLLSRAALPAACLLVAGYFGSHAVFGQTGILALDDIRAEKTELTQQNEKMKAELAALRHEAQLLDPRGVDPDFADELVRRQLGVVRPDEVIVPLG